MRIPIAAALLAFALAGCGGGNGSSALQPPAGAAAQSSANGSSFVESTIVVPGGSPSAQSNVRNAQFVSPSTLGLKVTVTDVPPTGSAASFTATTTYYTLSTGTNNIVVPTPATASGHTEDLTYVAYDQAPVGNAFPGAAKAVAFALAGGLTIVPGKNTNNVTLSGVVDGFPAPLAETGAVGMMSATPPSLAPAVSLLSFGGNANGVATLLDASGNNIATSDGGPWNVVGAVPATATTAGTGVPVTIAESAGTCGSVGTGPHLSLSFAGSTPATTAAISTTNGPLALDYDGKGGAGWSATVTAKGQSQSLVYTLSSLAVTSTNTDFSCANQTLAFSSTAEPTTLMNIVEHVTAEPYTLTVPAACSGFVNVYIGNSIAAGNLIAPGSSTLLGAAQNQFTVQLGTSGTTPCTLEIQDANAGSATGPNYPGGTTYVALLPVGYNQSITVP